MLSYPFECDVLLEKFYDDLRKAFVKSGLRARMMVVTWNEGSLNRYIHVDMVDDVPSEWVKFGLDDGEDGVVTPACSTAAGAQKCVDYEVRRMNVLRMRPIVKYV